MKTKTQKYENYKNSGVEWLGEIPEHWEVKRFKHISNIQKGKLPKKIVSTNDFNLPPYMSMEYLRGGEENQWVFDKDVKVIDENKTLLLWDGSNAGEFIKSRKGVISSTVAEIEFKYIHNNFAWYYSKFIEIELRKKTIGMGIPHVNGTELKNFSVAIPPISEQTAIANFLDDKTTKIDQAIAIKQKQIELLKERRQILIHKAVTRGLNDKVKLKDSGVEWIGEIPEHWEVKRLKYVANIVLGKMLCNEDKGNYKLKPYLKSKNIQWLNVEIESVDEMWFSEKEMSDYRLKKGDLILSEGGEVGKVCIWNNELDECYIQNSAHKVTVFNENVSEYYLYIFYTIGKFGVFDSVVNRVSIGHLTKEKLSNIEVINPPKQEQMQIIEFIETATAKIATAILLKEQEIEKLKEYKMSLIDGVVSGKVKVC